MLRFAPIIILLAFFQLALPQDTTNVPPWDVAPWPIENHRPQPEYPDIAKKAGGAWSADVRVHIDSLGSVLNVEIVRVRGEGLGLEEPVLSAVRNWKFAPAKKNDLSIPSMIDMTFNFVMIPALPQDTLTALNPWQLNGLNKLDESWSLHARSIHNRFNDSLVTYQPPPVLCLQVRVVSSSHP
jgi:TonB family protein